MYDVTAVPSSVLEKEGSVREMFPISGTVPGQAGWGSEHPDLVEDVPACCRSGGLDDL